MQTFSMDTHIGDQGLDFSETEPSNLDLYEKDKVNVWPAT